MVWEIQPNPQGQVSVTEEQIPHNTKPIQFTGNGFMKYNQTPNAEAQFSIQSSPLFLIKSSEITQRTNNKKIQKVSSP